MPNYKHYNEKILNSYLFNLLDAILFNLVIN